MVDAAGFFVGGRLDGVQETDLSEAVGVLAVTLDSLGRAEGDRAIVEFPCFPSGEFCGVHEVRPLRLLPSLPILSGDFMGNGLAVDLENREIAVKKNIHLIAKKLHAYMSILRRARQR